MRIQKSHRVVLGTTCYESKVGPKKNLAVVTKAAGDDVSRVVLNRHHTQSYIGIGV